MLKNIVERYKPQMTILRLCYRPTVFFCHLIFILQYPQEKIRRTFKKW
jgi:hypothetical protein